MRIVVAHNRYKCAGGEDSVMRSEVDMLQSAGHQVELLEADNSSIQSTGSKIVAATSLFYSERSSRRMKKLLATFNPDVLHIHNWFPLLSPSIVSAAHDAGVPVIQTLHNFRMLCVNGILYRDGKVCHDCVGKTLPLNGATHGCYSSSRIGSTLVAAAFLYHRLAHTWRGVSTFIALSEFQRDLLIRGGVDAARTVVKPNFVKQEQGAGTGRGGYALFAGRLTPEKGIRTVLSAWERDLIPMPLKIMGDGPLASEVQRRVAGMPRAEYLGQRTAPEVSSAMADARFIIFPSESYETFALTIVEAFSRGTPVLAADLESIWELVRDGETGLRFAPGDADDLAAKGRCLLSDTSAYRAMRLRCRSLYEERFTEEINYGLLMDIYGRVCVRAVV